MLPVYISYFTGRDNAESSLKRAVINSLGFVSGFTAVFVLLGAFAGELGNILIRYNYFINMFAGLIIVLFGLNYMGVVRVPFINRTGQIRVKNLNPGYLSSMLLGAVFSISWTPCAGAFLGSALMMAVSEGERSKGILMLLSYSLGLGIPFILSALLIERLKTTFEFIRRHYRTINLVSGGLLIILGILIATGYMGYFLSILAF